MYDEIVFTTVIAGEVCTIMRVITQTKLLAIGACQSKLLTDCKDKLLSLCNITL